MIWTAMAREQEKTISWIYVAGSKKLWFILDQKEVLILCIIWVLVLRREERRYAPIFTKLNGKFPARSQIPVCLTQNHISLVLCFLSIPFGVPVKDCREGRMNPQRMLRDSQARPAYLIVKSNICSWRSLPLLNRTPTVPAADMALASVFGQAFSDGQNTKDKYMTQYVKHHASTTPGFSLAPWHYSITFHISLADENIDLQSLFVNAGAPSVHD
jgi:hypothetical protein